MKYNFSGLKYNLSVHDVEIFIKECDKVFDGRLSRYFNYSRVVSLAEFRRLIEELNLIFQEKVGVISGSKDEPELKFIKSSDTRILNFSDSLEYDLDGDWTSQDPENFSLTICNQVFEHIYNPHVAIKNLMHHTKIGGYIYVSIPTINCIHSDPYFYSSGFHPRFLERLAIENNLEPVNIGFWGSHKYLINAVSEQWLTSNQLKKGIHRLRDMQFPFAMFQDGRKNSSQYITDCWGLFKKVR